MKKILSLSLLLFLIVAVVALIALKPTADVQEEQSDDTAQVVKDRVEAIYDEVFGCYLSSADAISECDFDTREFLAEDYWATYETVTKVEEDGEMGFFESDHWIQGQDWDSDLALTVDSVQMISPERALVYIRITNFGNMERCALEMSCEGNQWLIDDFITFAPERISEKEQMKQYIAEAEQKDE